MSKTDSPVELTLDSAVVTGAPVVIAPAMTVNINPRPETSFKSIIAPEETARAVPVGLVTASPGS